MHPADMTRAQLLAAIAKADKQSSALRDQMIDSGRGFEFPTETRTKSDALSVAYCAILDLESALGTERRRRLEWHGTEHRIIRSTV